MDVRSIGLPHGEAANDGQREFSVRHIRTRLQVLDALAAEIEKLKRSPDAWRRLQVSDPSEAAKARAAANIAAWRSYLPEDCVNAMIRDGWQWST